MEQMEEGLRVSDSEFRHGFTAVDDQKNLESWVRILDTLTSHPFFRRYRRRLLEILNARITDLLLEVGCGNGRVALNVADTYKCRVVGCDLSSHMLREARGHGLGECVQSDALALGFQDESFSGIWADRTMQHLSSPDRFLREAWRVLRPGGRFCAVDPDYGSQVLAFDDPELAQKVLDFRADCLLAQGTLAHRLAGYLTMSGFQDVSVEGLTMNIHDSRDLDDIMGLKSWAGVACKAGVLTPDELVVWEAMFEQRVATGRFFYGLTYYLTHAVKP